MARFTSRAAEDGDPRRVAARTDRGEPRDLTEPRELSLEEVLKSYEQPINEEQAWAVCYQCCSGLRVPRPPAATAGRVKEPSCILLHRDGTVSLQQQQQHEQQHDDGKSANFRCKHPPLSTLFQKYEGKMSNVEKYGGRAALLSIKVGSDTLTLHRWERFHPAGT